ncbi:unnamed protein product [Bathycoccus prasinos]
MNDPFRVQSYFLVPMDGANSKRIPPERFIILSLLFDAYDASSSPKAFDFASLGTHLIARFAPGPDNRSPLETTKGGDANASLY